MKRILKIGGTVILAILGTLWGLASCDVIRIADFRSGRLLAPIEYAATQINQRESERKVNASYATYNNSDLGVVFKHPAYIEITTDTQKDRDKDGNLLTLTYLHGQSTSNPVLGIFVITRSDPVLTSFPGWYPPEDGFLRASAFEYLSGLTLEKNDTNKQLLWDAAQKASITKIAGFPAAAYEVEIADNNIGRMYLRGASVISPKHQTDVLVVGANEPDAPGSLTKAQIFDIWTELTSSMVLPE